MQVCPYRHGNANILSSAFLLKWKPVIHLRKKPTCGRMVCKQSVCIPYLPDEWMMVGQEKSGLVPPDKLHYRG